MGIATFRHPFSQNGDNLKRIIQSKDQWEVVFKNKIPGENRRSAYILSNPSVLAKGSLKFKTSKGSI